MYIAKGILYGHIDHCMNALCNIFKDEMCCEVIIPITKLLL